MLKIYGSMQCPDCRNCREALDRANISYEYLDFSANLRNLKEFLALRDSSDAFQPVKENGTIGIPCILWEDGTLTLDWKEVL